VNTSEVTWSGIGFLLVLLLRGFLVLSEFSLVNLRYSDVSEATLARLRKINYISYLLDNLKRAGETIRIGRKLCSLATGSFLFLLIYSLFLHKHVWVAMFLAVVLGVLVQVLLSDLIPRFLAGLNPQKSLRTGAWSVFVFWIIGWPFLKIQDWLRGPLKKWTNQESGDALNPLDVEVQLRAMGEDSSALPPMVRQILSQTLQFEDLVVQDILLPRNQVIILDTTKPLQENLDEARQVGHTRYPLCEGDLDHCEGIIHIKDIFRFRGDWDRINLENLKRPAVSFSTDETLAEVLPKMMQYKAHMALGKDEFGGVVGVVSLEKILETMVGEIQDEFDEEEELITKFGKNTYLISGLTPLYDVEEELGIPAGGDEDEVSTFGGLLITKFGRIPKSGEEITFRGMQVRVVEADARLVRMAEVQKLEKPIPDNRDKA
jgi:CBS domain containing-hemolysin-like protein